MEILNWEPKLIQLEHTLAKNDYFTKGPLPGYPDAVIFKLLLEKRKYPDKKSYPFFYHWYVIMRQFSITSIDRWIKEKIYQDINSQKLINTIYELFKKNLYSAEKNKVETVVSYFSKQNDENSVRNLEKWQQSLALRQKSKGEKLNYVMVIILKNLNNLQKLQRKLHGLKIQIKQLKLDRKQKRVFLKFSLDSDLYETYKTQISSWQEVDRVLSKKIITRNSQNIQIDAQATKNIR